jgi:type II secretory pathway pseudopilin PulG
LFELVIVIVVVSIAALSFAGLFIQAVNTYQYVDTEKSMLQEGRYAMERIARELKRVRNNTSVTTAGLTTFTFVDRGSQTVSISWSGVAGDDLVYTKAGVARTLAAGVDSMAFEYRRADGTTATPIVSPSITDVWRIALYLRLARGSQKLATTGSAFVRSL